MRRGFTLIELLIVIAIIAILAVVVVLVLNPGQLLAQGRDSNRLSDLNTLTNAIDIYQTDTGHSPGNANTVYVSIPDSSPSCLDLSLPALPSGWSYACAPSSTYRNTDGTGWIPIDLTKVSSGDPLSNLPVDPINNVSSCLYYTYTTNGLSFGITAAAESQKERAALAVASGTYADLFSAGSDPYLEPIDYAQGCQPGSSYNPALAAHQVVATNQQGQNSTVTFAATAGQSLSMDFASDTYSSMCAYYYRPDGSTIDWNCTGATNNWTQGPYSLSQTGTYKITVVPQGTATGTVTVSAFVYGNQSYAITPGTPITTSSTIQGQYTNLTFSATAGQSLSMDFASDTYSGICPFYLRPDGSTIDWNCTGATNNWTQGPYSLSQTGTYTIQIRPEGTATGTVTTNAFIYSNQSYAITPGTPITTSSTIQGQYTNLTFSATAGQSLSMDFASDTYSGICPFYLRPDGSTIDWNCTGATNNWTQGPYSLSQTGTYTIQIRPEGTATGTVTTNAFIYSNQSYAITPGTPITTSSTIQGQYTNLTFSATAGQSLSMDFASDTYSGICPFYLRPDGSTIDWNCTGATNNWTQGPYSLSQTGTYTIQIRPEGTATGTVTTNISVQ